MIVLRDIDPAELPAIVDDIDDVMRRAYGTSSFRRQLEWYSAVQPDGFVVAEDEGTIIGAGCAIAYADGRFGWIGLIATDPSRERQGIGRMVTERVAEVLGHHGCGSVLDASLAGGPLYARMGFVDHGITRVLSATNRPRSQRTSVERFTPADVADVADFDRFAFGANRLALIDVVLAQNAGRAGLVRDSSGSIVGYVIAQESVIGPLVADDAEVVSELIRFALTLGWEQPPRISVPPESSHLLPLERLGFDQTRELRHMRRGIDALPGAGHLIAGRASLGVG